MKHLTEEYKIKKTVPSLREMELWGREGSVGEVDRLMAWLRPETEGWVCGMVNHALNLVENLEGRLQLRHYLFSGTAMQRNYAALYFKRRGRIELLEEAVARGCIDHIQAFSR